jgi:hypothetical protein
MPVFKSSSGCRHPLPPCFLLVPVSPSGGDEKKSSRAMKSKFLPGDPEDAEREPEQEPEFE